MAARCIHAGGDGLFSTSRELASFSRQYEYTVFEAVSVCDDGRFDEARQVAPTRHVYDDLGDGNQRSRNSPVQTQGPDGRFTYWLFLDLATRARPEGSHIDPSGFFIDHDLRRDRDDLCFVLRGGAMWGLGWHRSKTVVIPYAAIRAALDRAGM